jgi:hypothetical protein
MKKYLLNNTYIFLCNNMKFYKKSQKKKTDLKTSNAFLRVKMMFFDPENDYNGISIKLVDLIVNFS